MKIVYESSDGSQIKIIPSSKNTRIFVDGELTAKFNHRNFDPEEKSKLVAVLTSIAEDLRERQASGEEAEDVIYDMLNERNAHEFRLNERRIENYGVSKSFDRYCIV